jgi:hypothetical protein
MSLPVIDVFLNVTRNNPEKSTAGYKFIQQNENACEKSGKLRQGSAAGELVKSSTNTIRMVNYLSGFFFR